MKFYTRRLVLVVAAVILLGVIGLANRTAGRVRASGGGNVWEVYPTGDPALDVPNVQLAIDSASDGDTILLKAGTFDFGNWKTNPVPGGFVVINKGVTLQGDGFDVGGNPKTIILGGGYRQKNHGQYGEYGVITFSGDASGGVLEGIWLKEPHYFAVATNGFSGQNHENITIRNVKITDISQDIPTWYPNASIGRSIDLGANIPEWGLGGPSGTVTIEGCTISNRGSSVDLDFIDPETGTPYYRDPEGNPLLVHDSQGIGLWMCTAVSFVIRDNTLVVQNEGIVTEGMGGTGNIIISNNDISVEPVALSRHLLHGYRLDGWNRDWMEIPFARVVRIENNRIQVVGEPEPDLFTAGMIMGADHGVPGYDGTVVVKGNEIEIQNGDGALVFAVVVTDQPHFGVLNGAEIRNNRIRGDANYGLLSVGGAHDCSIFGNNMATFVPSVAHIGFYGSGTHDNTVRGYSGVVDEADGAYDNYITGYTPMSPHAAKPNVPPIQ
jgi:hypothetical protein